MSASSLELGTPECPPVLGADDPDPFGKGRQHPDLGEWTNEVAEAFESDHGDRSAGLYLDQEAGEVVILVVGPDPEAVLDDVRATVPDEHAAQVSCRHAAWTEAQLREIQRVAHEAIEGPASSGVDTVRNRVLVDLEVGDPEAIRSVVAGELGADAAAALEVVVPACAEVAEVPADATPLPGDGSTCSGMDALAAGVLIGDPATGCLALEGDPQDVPLAFPRGWYLTADGNVHDHQGEVRARLGDHVEAGGGHVPVDDDDGGCGWDDGAFLVNSLTPD